jgi:hypothetical protein
MEKYYSEVFRWANRIGYRQAVAMLYVRGVSARVSELICQGKYTKKPGAMIRHHIANAMAEASQNKEKRTK